MIYSPIMRSAFWTVMLGIVLMFWPTNSTNDIHKEVIAETKFVYIKVPIALQEKTIEQAIKEPEKEVISPKYGFTDDEIYLMTVLLCGSGTTDGDGEYDIDFNTKDTHEQTSLVLSIVMNRVMSNKFPNTVSEVIWASGQFSPMPRWVKKLPVVSDSSYQVVKKWCEAYDKHDLSVMSIPESHLYFTGDGKINRSRERW